MPNQFRFCVLLVRIIYCSHQIAKSKFGAVLGTNRCVAGCWVDLACIALHYITVNCFIVLDRLLLFVKPYFEVNV